MRDVAVLGVGRTPVREHWELSVRDLLADAGQAALDDSGRGRVDAVFVGNMTAGTLNQQLHLGAVAVDALGLWGAEAMRFEAACGSAGSAMRQGIMAVASGVMNAVLVIGVEKMLDSSPRQTTAALAQAADADYETPSGVTFVALNALIMRRYMHEYGYSHDDFAPFAINAHANGIKNPYALFHEAISLKEYRKGRSVSPPIQLYDASPIGDGAAAVLLVPASEAPQAVRVAGSAVATDTLAIHDREDPLWLAAAEKSAQQAFRQAGIGPQDVDIFELHDAFSIMAALSLEACGFAARGQGVKLAQSGAIFSQGKLPISTMGGLKARGHPVGATGLYQIVEATLQLRGQAGEAQIDDVHIALTQNIGGSGATIATHVLVGSR